MGRVPAGAHRGGTGGRIEDTAMFQAHIEPLAPGEHLLESVAAGDSPAREVYRRLQRAGLDAVEAGNLTARVKGLPPVDAGWRVPEIERLLFLRWRLEHGRVPR
jgi:hypothetical protein